MKTKNHQHLWSQFETCERPVQVVFLGASNLSRSFPSAVDVARHTFARPLTIHAAMGFGRSYGKESGFMGKKFSGIFSSRLWDAIECNTAHPSFAFVTDIGNDLAYEQPVDAIMEWVEGCVTRLTSHGAKIALTGLPMDALRRVNQPKFQVLRSILFPSCRLTWPVLLERAEELSARLQRLAETQKTPIFSVPNAWYGFDPIHPRGRVMRDYWRALFSLVQSSEQPAMATCQVAGCYWRIRLMSSPAISQKAPTGWFLPSRIQLADGTTIHLH